MTDILRDSRIEKALVIFVAFTGFAVGYACCYGATSTTFILPLTEQFGWGRVVPSLMYVGAMSGVVVASFFLGGLMERFGEVLVAAVSGVCLAVVMALHSTMSGSPVVAVVLALLAGLLGAGTGAGLWVAILPKWFDHQLGRALGIAVIGQSAGSALMPPISAGLIASRGWRDAYLGLAAIELIVTLAIVALLAKLMRSRQAETATRTTMGYDGMTLEEALRCKSFWLLQLVMILQTIGMFAITFHLFPIYHDLGLDWGMLPQVTITLAIGMAFGRLASGILLDFIEAKFVALGMFLIGAAAISLLASLTVIESNLMIYLPSALVGVALGAETDILAYFARRLFGLRHYAVIYNRLLMGFFLGSMAGPFILGWAFDNLSNPQLCLWALAGSCCLAALMSQFLPSVRHDADAHGGGTVPAQAAR